MMNVTKQLDDPRPMAQLAQKRHFSHPQLGLRSELRSTALHKISEARFPRNPQRRTAPVRLNATTCPQPVPKNKTLQCSALSR
jgi:hypothetical protein